MHHEPCIGSVTLTLSVLIIRHAVSRPSPRSPFVSAPQDSHCRRVTKGAGVQRLTLTEWARSTRQEIAEEKSSLLCVAAHRNDLLFGDL